MYKSFVFVLAVISASAFALKFKPAPRPCGVTIHTWIENEVDFTFSLLGDGLFRLLSVFEDDEHRIEMMRSDIKNDDGDMFSIAVYGYNEGGHSCLRCASEWIDNETLVNRLHMSLDRLFAEREYVTAVACPDICDGCNKYCEDEEDAEKCGAATSDYFVANSDAQIVVYYYSGFFHAEYGAAPDPSIFALDLNGCFDKLEAPQENPCPVPPPSSSSATPTPAPTSSSTVPPATKSSSTQYSAANRITDNMFISFFIVCIANILVYVSF